jgi:hypothetical protein
LINYHILLEIAIIKQLCHDLSLGPVTKAKAKKGKQVKKKSKAWQDSKHVALVKGNCGIAKEEPSNLFKMVSFCEFDVLGCFKVWNQYLKLKAFLNRTLFRPLKMSQRVIQ